MRLLAPKQPFVHTYHVFKPFKRTDDGFNRTDSRAAVAVDACGRVSYGFAVHVDGVCRAVSHTATAGDACMRINTDGQMAKLAYSIGERIDKLGASAAASKFFLGVGKRIWRKFTFMKQSAEFGNNLANGVVRKRSVAKAVRCTHFESACDADAVRGEQIQCVFKSAARGYAAVCEIDKSGGI